MNGEIPDIPLYWFLLFAAASFAIGLFGVLVRRNAIAVLMAIEIMLNAANINLIAFWRYGPAPPAAGEGPCIHHFAVEVDDVGKATKQVKAYGCEIISDPGVIPVKFRAPGGTVCELVPKGRYKKPGSKKKAKQRR